MVLVNPATEVILKSEILIMDMPPPEPPVGSTPPPEIPLLPPEPNKEDRTWAMVAHLSGLAGYVIPLGNIVGPLVILILKRESSLFVEDQAKEALNAQLSVTLYVMIALVLLFVLIGFVLLPFLLIADLILIIVAAVAANEGRRYRYPLILRLIR